MDEEQVKVEPPEQVDSLYPRTYYPSFWTISEDNYVVSESDLQCAIGLSFIEQFCLDASLSSFSLALGLYAGGSVANGGLKEHPYIHACGIAGFALAAILGVVLVGLRRSSAPIRKRLRRQRYGQIQIKTR
jgi:hypothetical protein